MKNDLILAIIQARMKSTRLPGKVMKEILGIPIIGHMIDRLRHSKKIDRIIVATSSDPSNSVMCDYLGKNNIEYYRGSEDDVLERFYLAANKFDTKHIIRLTADCPLIDPDIIDLITEEYFKNSADYACTDQRFAEGLDVEIFSFKILEEAFLKARKQSEREHVTQYFHNNPDKFKILQVVNKSDDSMYRITVDNEEDFFVVSKIFEALYQDSNSIFPINDIIDFLNNNPAIYNINKHIIRNEGLLKSLENDKEVKLI